MGLAIVLLRGVWERRAELALLQALGFRSGQLAWLVLAENAFLLVLGLAAGTVSALLAVAPHLVGMGAQVLWLRIAVLLVSNNAVSLDYLSLGERERVDEGALHLYFTERLFPWRWQERSCESFTIDAAAGTVAAAIDGEPAELELPVVARIEPLALRLLQPQA